MFTNIRGKKKKQQKTISLQAFESQNGNFKMSFMSQNVKIDF